MLEDLAFCEVEASKGFEGTEVGVEEVTREFDTELELFEGFGLGAEELETEVCSDVE